MTASKKLERIPPLHTFVEYQSACRLLGDLRHKCESGKMDEGSGDAKEMLELQMRVDTYEIVHKINTYL